MTQFDALPHDTLDELQTSFRTVVPFPGAAGIDGRPAGIEPSDVAPFSSAVPASASSPNPEHEVALYEPGNENSCRKLLDQAVAADHRTFTLGDRGGPLVILRVPKEEELPAETKWQGDLPGTTLATPADVVERAQTIPWYQRRKGRLVRIHAPRLFASDYLLQMRGGYGAPVLIGISRVPAIEDDGSVSFLSGHDRRTGLSYDRPVKFDIPEFVSHGDAKEAAKQLMFPFAAGCESAGLGRGERPARYHRRKTQSDCSRG
jgi:hypothetical protein